MYNCSSSKGSDIQTDDPEQAFKIAKSKYDKGDYLDAIDDFSFMKIRFPGTSNADRVQFYLADSYYNRDEYLLSAYEYETMLRSYPLSNLIPDARYKLGLSYYHLSPKYSLDQEYTHYAISELTAYLELYPTDKHVADAEVKLRELKDKLAYRDFHTGELYMGMRDYKSAAIYFQNVYDTYIDSKWADDAMLGQVEALVTIKKNNEAKKVLDRFYKLFPNSDLKTKADKLKNTI